MKYKKFLRWHRVNQTVRNRTGSTGSRWNRSGPVHEPVRLPLTNRACIFLTITNRPVSPVYRPVFFEPWKPAGGGLVNPGWQWFQPICSGHPKRGHHKATRGTKSWSVNTGAPMNMRPAIIRETRPARMCIVQFRPVPWLFPSTARHWHNRL
jgi:hypothetical protein